MIKRSRAGMKYLVIDVGGTFTKYAVMDESSEFYEKSTVPTARDSLEDFVEMLATIYGDYKDTVSGIAVSAPGIIDSDCGFMYNGGSVFCLKNLNLVEILEKRCGVAVTVENDAKCAALAEVWKGVLSDCRNAVALIIGTAVGGAVICDRKILRGNNFMAGEFSYIFTDARDCMNRNKLLAKTGGVPGLIAMVSEKKGIPKEELDGEKIFSMANCGDGETLECLRAFCSGLAVQISNYQFIIDPQRVAIGGGISVQPLLLQMIKEELKKINAVFPHSMPVPDVAACKFFNDSNLIGALYVHLRAQEGKLDIN